MRGSGSCSSGRRSEADSGSCSRPRESTACWRTRLLSSASAARSTSCTAGPVDLAEGLHGGRAARSRAGREAAATSAGAAPASRMSPRVCAARTCASVSSPESACRSSGRDALRGSCARAPPWRSPGSARSRRRAARTAASAASSSPRRPMAAAASARTSAAGSWMSGATSAMPSGGAIQARQRTVPWSHRVVRVPQPGGRTPPGPGSRSRRARGPRTPARRARRGARCSGPVGARLAQPAQGDGRGAPVAGRPRRPASRGGGRRGPRAAAPPAPAGRGSRPTVDARCSISTTARMASVAQRRVGVVEVGRDARQGVAAGHAAEGLERGPAKHLVVEERERARARRAGRRSRRGRGWPGTAATARRAAPR